MSTLTDFRREKDEFFGSNPQSPLTPGQQGAFDGLAYYDEQPALALELAPEQFERPETIEMQTSTGDVAQYQRWARINFEVGGEPSALTIYRYPAAQRYSPPSQHLTAAQQTPGECTEKLCAGKHGGRLLVDFNYAYNPYCAYNERWSCPIPPAENRLAVAIEAGEKVFPDAPH